MDTSKYLTGTPLLLAVIFVWGCFIFSVLLTIAASFVGLMAKEPITIAFAAGSIGFSYVTFQVASAWHAVLKKEK